ncbi:MAG: hypothetical protein ABW166_01445 [Sedimenticola sp.]
MKLIMGLTAGILLAVGSANAATIDLLHNDTNPLAAIDSDSGLSRGGLAGDGTGSVQIYGTSLGFLGNHQFQFTVSDNANLVIDFSLSTGGLNLPPPAPMVTLIDLSGTITSVNVSLDSTSGTISGLVAAQDYQLDLVGNVSFYNLTLTASPVPLPAAAWLFGSALVGFGFLSRRKAV